MFGNLVEFHVEGNKVVFNYEKSKGIVEVITPEIINIFLPLKREEKLSKAIENLTENKVFFEVEKSEDKVLIRTEKLYIEVKPEFKVDFYDLQRNILCADYLGEREPFIRRGVGNLAEEEGHKINKVRDKLAIEVLKELEGNEYIYGLGDKTGHLNKKGYHYKMWNTDDPSPHVESFEAMYKSIPFFIVLKQGMAYGIFFDNPFKSYFDFGKENSKYYYFGAEDGNLDYYFIYGPSIAQVIKGYTFLTGTTPLPQLWTLGYHQSRWSYTPEQRVTEIAENFRKRDIPCDVICLDIDYMDGFRVFTWDKEKFANPQIMISKLKEQGFKVVTIVDPGVKKDKGYFVYDEGLEKGYFVRDKDGIPYVNKVWPGDSVYPDFSDEETRRWWADKHKILLDCGVAGIWNDMNEPASFNGALPDDLQFKNDGYPTDHREIHNLYGHLMSKSTYEGIKKFTNKRPFVITRACFSGTQKYSTVWTGDNQSFWEHLRMSIPMLLNLGLSGFSFCGTDVGGFGFDCTGELLSRWVQVGCFTPLFRNHTAMHTRDQEPWAFDERTEEINRKYIKLRYELIPYLYDLLYHGEKTGLPVMRPLVLHYQGDRETYEINDQFLWGENFLVAPILQQGQRARSVYLPKGKWFDYWTGEEIQGGRYVVKETPLDLCPIYIKEGSIIPKFPVQNYIGEREIDNLIIDIYPGNGQYLHYQDDGESFNYRQGQYNLYQFTMVDGKNLEITVNLAHYGYPKIRDFTFNINNVEAKEVIVNGKGISFINREGKVTFTPCGEKLDIKIIK
ncbi:alpha-glucosidase [Anaerobranca californiensis DSM 14826]|uniref:Alpha-glucosidase n=1 Tax=Anaerobranca californiensis DSM 14826 TaxID=1120989 RepID=A0A1M6LH66_9FIRM|nr:glycoside hydrolase family 31 protein [Anaerobranca californiensis]SHJ70540.1 alpha-glucosidase [Anaerobranca californiensis DSM 14826]